MTVYLYRDAINVTMPGEFIDRYELGDLHATLCGVPIPCWFAMVLLFPRTRTLRYSKRGSYTEPYKHLPKIDGDYFTLGALVADGYYAGQLGMLRRSS